MDTYGYVTTFAGQAEVGSEDGQGTFASFNWPWGISCNQFNGEAYVADTYNALVRVITTAANVMTLAGGGLSGFDTGNLSRCRSHFDLFLQKKIID